MSFCSVTNCARYVGATTPLIKKINRHLHINTKNHEYRHNNLKKNTYEIIFYQTKK